MFRRCNCLQLTLFQKLKRNPSDNTRRLSILLNENNNQLNNNNNNNNNQPIISTGIRKTRRRKTKTTSSTTTETTTTKQSPTTKQLSPIKLSPNKQTTTKSTKNTLNQQLSNSSNQSKLNSTIIDASLATDHLDPPSLDLPLPHQSNPSSSNQHQLHASFSFSSSSVPFESVQPSTPQPPVATLAHGLSRVLFNPGVHWLQDPRTLVYNFDHRLQDLVSPEQFNFDALTPYLTSSRDQQLIQLAQNNHRKYSGSTSSMTQTLSQIYLMLNGSKPLNTGMLTANAVSTKKKVEFTPGAKMPASIILRYDPQTQKYSIDADKSFESDTDDCPDSTILSSLGHVLEKFFVLPYDEFSKLLKNSISKEGIQTKLRETYAFGKTNLLMTRSQLDCFHHFLPGNGTFDIKTRATIAIRHDRLNHANAAGYQIRTSQGPLESFEREYLDLIRSAFLKYQFQARIGQMDGIFVAYHNTQRVFGFEYLPVSKMDQALFGNSEEGDKVFKLCLGYLERILEDATKAYPEQSLRITTSTKSHGNLWVFVSPDQGEDSTREPPSEYITFNYRNYNYIDGSIIEANHVDLETESQAKLRSFSSGVNGNGTNIMDNDEFGVMSSSEHRKSIDWSIFCQTYKYSKSDQLDQLYRSIRRIQFAISQLVLPEGVDRQLVKIDNWPESESKNGHQIENESEKHRQEDDLSPSSPSSLGTGSSSQHGFVATKGLQYKRDVSKLVQHLRIIAKDGWKIQADLIESQKDKKVISLKPVEYLVQDRLPNLSNRITAYPSSLLDTSSSSLENNNNNNNSISHDGNNECKEALNSNNDLESSLNWQDRLVLQERHRQLKALDILSSSSSDNHNNNNQNNRNYNSNHQNQNQSSFKKN